MLRPCDETPPFRPERAAGCTFLHRTRPERALQAATLQGKSEKPQAGCQDRLYADKTQQGVSTNQVKLPVICASRPHPEMTITELGL